MATGACCDETAEVGRCRHVADLERQHGLLVCDPSSDRQPVELMQ